MKGPNDDARDDEEARAMIFVDEDDSTTRSSSIASASDGCDVMHADKPAAARKDSHLDLALNPNTRSGGENGFDRISFIHCALPEVSLSAIDLSTEFLGKLVNVPFKIRYGVSINAGNKYLNKVMVWKSTVSSNICKTTGNIAHISAEIDAKVIPNLQRPEILFTVIHPSFDCDPLGV